MNIIFLIFGLNCLLILQKVHGFQNFNRFSRNHLHIIKTWKYLLKKQHPEEKDVRNIVGRSLSITQSPEIKKYNLVDKSLFSRISLLACSILYGSNYVVSVLLQKSLPPSILTTIRFLLATIVFIPDLIKNSFNLNAFLGGVEIGIWCSIGFITQAMSLQFTSASKASFFSGLGVVFVPLLDYIFKRKKRERERDQTETSPHKKSPFHSALIAFLGVAILECGGIEPPHVKDLFLLLTPMAFATSFWRAEKVSRKYPQYTPLTVFGTMLTVSVTSIIWAIFDRSFPLSFSSLKLLFEKIITHPLVAMGLLYIGLICTGWASFSEQSAMQHITAAETTLIYTLEPLAATLFSSLILHESIGLNTGFGAFFIILGCLYSSIENFDVKRIFSKTKI